MGDIMFNLYVLLGFMAIGALIAIETEDLLSSVIALGAVGFGLSVIDLLLKAPDLAITQVVVEILTLVILIRVIVTRKDRTKETHKDTFVVGSAVLFLGILLFASYLAFAHLEPFGKPLMTIADGYIRNGLPDINATNYVTQILLDFRGYDTIGEATVIFVSILGALAVMRKIGRKKNEQKS